MSDILFWDANNPAGSGSMWSTEIDTPQTVPDHVIANGGWEVPISNNVGEDGINRPDIPLMVSSTPTGISDQTREIWVNHPSYTAPPCATNLEWEDNKENEWEYICMSILNKGILFPEDQQDVNEITHLLIKELVTKDFL